jgi:hypothetical protein
MAKTSSTYLPIKLFLIISAIYNLPSIFCALFFSDISILFLSESAKNSELAYEYLVLIAVSSIITVATFFLSNAIFKNIKIDTYNTEVNKKLLLGIFSLLYFFIVVLTVVSYGVSEYFTGYNTNPFADTNASINALYFATEFVFGTGFLIYLSGVKRSTLSYLFLLLLVLGFSIFAVRMKRLEILVIIIALLVTRNLDGKPFRYFLFLVVVSIFSLAGAYRNGVTDFAEVLFSSALSFTLESNFSSNSVFEYLSNASYYSQFHEYFIRYLALPLAMVPQFMLPFDKADMLIAFPPALGVDEIATLSPGGASKLIAALLFQGGYFGVVLGSIFIGFILFSYRLLLVKYANSTFIRNCVVLSLVSLSMHAMRDSPILAIKLQIQFVILVLVMWKLNKFLIKIKFN